MSKDNNNFKELVQDLALNLLKWIVVTACAFLYWMGVLLLISIFLMNIWHTSIEELIKYGIILTMITSVAYAGKLIYNKFK